MQLHTIRAIGASFALFLIVPPLALGFLAVSGAGKLAGEILGAVLHLASALIFWSWLSADAQINPVPRSARITAIVAYVVFFVLAVAGYLIYSRGGFRGLGAAMWFALLVAGVITSIVVEMAALNAFFHVIALR